MSARFSLGPTTAYYFHAAPLKVLRGVAGELLREGPPRRRTRLASARHASSKNPAADSHGGPWSCRFSRRSLEHTAGRLRCATWRCLSAIWWFVNIRLPASWTGAAAPGLLLTTFIV